MVQIYWTERAKEDLKNIAEFISRDSVYYAEKQLDKLYESVEILYEHSEIGRPVPEYEMPNLRQLLVSKYRLIYLVVNDSRIDIITVHHSARMLNLEI
jgi:addiction module RelE/StbE family toxin